MQTIKEVSYHIIREYLKIMQSFNCQTDYYSIEDLYESILEAYNSYAIHIPYETKEALLEDIKEEQELEAFREIYKSLLKAEEDSYVWEKITKHTIGNQIRKILLMIKTPIYYTEFSSTMADKLLSELYYLQVIKNV